MIYIAKVDWYCDLDNTTEHRGMYLAADSYSDAMEKLIKYFGENEIMSCSLELYAPDDMLEFNLDNEKERITFDIVKSTLDETIVW